MSIEHAASHLVGPASTPVPWLALIPFLPFFGFLTGHGLHEGYWPVALGW